MRKIVIISVWLIFVLVIASIAGCTSPQITSVVDPRNVILQQRMNEVINDDERNSGIVIKPYMKSGDVLVFDLQAISGSNSRLDVFRVFLQFAEKNTDMTFQRVELAYKGNEKFYVDGLYYRQLGEEYSWQNPIYTMRKFPSNLYYEDGSKAYSEWTGGILGVLKEETEDFLDFHNQWYWNELSKAMGTLESDTGTTKVLGTA